VGGDPFRHVGRQDLTATVDLATVRGAAARAGLEPLGETTQAELLAAVGSGGLVQSALRGPGVSLEDGLRLRSALARLLDPRGMGGFRVLAYGRRCRPAPTSGLRRLRRDRAGTCRSSVPPCQVDRCDAAVLPGSSAGRRC
jgi:SAM-dependent MidA family methyltransferase